MHKLSNLSPVGTRLYGALNGRANGMLDTFPSQSHHDRQVLQLTPVSPRTNRTRQHLTSHAHHIPLQLFRHQLAG